MVGGSLVENQLVVWIATVHCDHGTLQFCITRCLTFSKMASKLAFYCVMGIRMSTWIPVLNLSTFRALLFHCVASWAAPR